MPELNLDRRLESLAGQAGSAGRLDTAADVRRRADRRRRRRYAGSAVLGALVATAFGVGIALGQPRQRQEPPIAPLPAVSPAPVTPPTPSTLQYDDPSDGVKAPPPYSAAFSGPPPTFPTVAPPTDATPAGAHPSPPMKLPPPDDPTDG